MNAMAQPAVAGQGLKRPWWPVSGFWPCLRSDLRLTALLPASRLTAVVELLLCGRPAPRKPAAPLALAFNKLAEARLRQPAVCPG